MCSAWTCFYDHGIFQTMTRPRRGVPVVQVERVHIPAVEEGEVLEADVINPVMDHAQNVRNEARNHQRTRSRSCGSRSRSHRSSPSRRRASRRRSASSRTSRGRSPGDRRTVSRRRSPGRRSPFRRSVTSQPWFEPRERRQHIEKRDLRLRLDRRARSRSRDRRRRTRSLSEKSSGRRTIVQEMKEEMKEMQRKIDSMSAVSEVMVYGNMVKKNHQQQMDFNLGVKSIQVNEMRTELSRTFPTGIPARMMDILSKGEKKVDLRCKMIAIADSSEFGWVTSEEYAGQSASCR